MKLNMKRIQRHAFRSMIFAIIYAIILRFRMGMDLMTFMRLVSLFAIIFLVVTMFFDIVIQLIGKFISKK